MELDLGMIFNLSMDYFKNTLIILVNLIFINQFPQNKRGPFSFQLKIICEVYISDDIN